MKLKFSKVKDVDTPNIGTEGSAGIDFFVPIKDSIRRLSPGEHALIASGIKADIPAGYALIAFNKSGVSIKKKLMVGACVVDSDYQGEIHLHVINVGKEVAEINPGDKLVQFVLMPYLKPEIEEVPLNGLFIKSTSRGSGGFGSTGTSSKTKKK